ncbi:hypothetical protein AGMMS49975_09200 [Clostridia bacterium]|nr:hypothetical protein AGMMS49975_09200 [Clostridia bacterium]
MNKKTFTVGEKIRIYRTTREITQKELSTKSGIAEITLKEYEANKYIPKIDKLKKIAEILEVSVEELTNGEGVHETTFSKITKSILCEEHGEKLLFELKDTYHFSIGLSTLLECLKFAEKERAIPPLPQEWWESFGKKKGE